MAQWLILFGWRGLRGRVRGFESRTKLFMLANGKGRPKVSPLGFCGTTRIMRNIWTFCRKKSFSEHRGPLWFFRHYGTYQRSTLELKKMFEIISKSSVHTVFSFFLVSPSLKVDVFVCFGPVERMRVFNDCGKDLRFLSPICNFETISFDQKVHFYFHKYFRPKKAFGELKASFPALLKIHYWKWYQVYSKVTPISLENRVFPNRKIEKTIFFKCWFFDTFFGKKVS